MDFDENDEEKLIERYCEEIITVLGEKFQFLSNDYNTPDGSHEGEYDGPEFGIKISATYTDSSYSKFKHIYVKFKNRTVYETINGKNRIFSYGAWQELLKELAYRAPNILKRKQEEREENRRKAEHALSLYRNYIKPIYKENLKINDTLSFQGYSDYYPGGYGNNIVYYHRMVKKNGKIVLDVSKEDLGDYTTVNKYIPGDWEKEIMLYCHNKIKYHDEKEKENNEALEIIRRLKKY